MASATDARKQKAAAALRQAKFKTETGKMITCILPKGKGVDLVTHLHKKHGIVTANIYSCRGTGMSTTVGKKAVGSDMEKDIVTVSVKNKEADELFEDIYFKMNMHKPHGGFMYLGDLSKCIHFVLPELPQS